MIAPRVPVRQLPLLALVLFFSAANANETDSPYAQVSPFPTPDLNKRKEKMVEAGVPPETAEKVIELTKEVQKLQDTPKPGSYRPEDLSPESRKQLQPLLDRGVPMERAVQMLLLQEKYQATLKELSSLPGGYPTSSDLHAGAVTAAPDPTPLNARLLATASRLGTESFAILEDGVSGTQQLYRVGNRFQNRTLASVGLNHVILRNGPQNEILKIIEPPAANTPTSLSGIQQKSEIEFRIDRAEVDNAMGNLNQLFTQIRAVPHFEEGKPTGFRLFAIRKDSIFDKIGLKNGDIIWKINGNELTNPARAMTLIQELQSAPHISVELIRNRQLTTLSYEIQRTPQAASAASSPVAQSLRLK